MSGEKRKAAMITPRFAASHFLPVGGHFFHPLTHLLTQLCFYPLLMTSTVFFSFFLTRHGYNATQLTNCRVTSCFLIPFVCTMQDGTKLAVTI